MLTAEGPIGRLVLFIVEKSLGKLAALSLDKRKKACRVLTRLYYCLQCLDEATDQVLEDFELAGPAESAGIVIASLDEHSYDIEAATNMFLQLGEELHGGLELIDPDLAQCCELLYVSKWEFLNAMSGLTVVDRSVVGKPKLTIKLPDDRLESVDLEQTYREFARHKDDQFYWPSSAFSLDRDLSTVTIEWDTEETAHALRNKIVQQNKLLKEAKERLRALLKDSFSVEEILFQSDSHPYR